MVESLGWDDRPGGLREISVEKKAAQDQQDIYMTVNQKFRWVHIPMDDSRMANRSLGDPNSSHHGCILFEAIF